MNKILKKILQNDKLYNFLIKNKLNFVDIGSAYGINKKLLNLLKKDILKVISFDPQPDYVFKEHKNVRFINAALWSQQSLLNFYLTKNRQCSSILKPNFNILEKFGKAEEFMIEKIETIQVNALDDVLSTENIYKVDFIKLDTQGSELFILNGAKNTLQKVFAVEVEVEFLPIYENQPLFCDLHKFLLENNFTLFDLRRHFWKYKHSKNSFNFKGHLVWGEALYFRDSEWCQSKEVSELVHYVIISILYNKADYAYEILEEVNDDILEINILKKILSQSRKSLINIPNFKGKYKIIKNLDNLRNFLFYQNGELSDVELGD